MAGRGRRRVVPPARRSGPAGESPWWDPTDQAFVERPLFAARRLGRGWSAMAMVNNAEQSDPYGEGPDADVLRAVVADRERTALHEGDAWRRRRDGALLVARVEAFTRPDDGAHRQVWADHGLGCLDALWRQRWRERDRVPGWIEARRDHPALDGADWITVEDHTPPVAEERQGVPEPVGSVTVYEHVTIWEGRALVTLTVRHGLEVDIAPVVQAAVAAARHRAVDLADRDG